MKKTKSLIITLLAIVLVCVLLIALQGGSQRSKAVIIKDGKIVKVVEFESLNQGFDYAVDEHNVVCIEPDGAYMKYSDCPKKECIHMGKKDNGSIICLPNRLEIKIVDDTEGAADAFTR